MARTDRVPENPDAATATGTGLVLTVRSRSEARAFRDVANRRDGFAVHNLRVVDAHGPRAAREPFERVWARTQQQCRRFGVSPAELDELDAMMTRAAPGGAGLLRHAIELCIADTGFALLLVDDTGDAGLDPSSLHTLARIFDRELLTASSVDAARSVRLSRPAPTRLERLLDRDLLAAILGAGDQAVRAWRAWQARVSIDDHIGFGEIAPALSENLSRLGVDDPDLGRVHGTRRRAWYVNQILVRDAVDAVLGLRDAGCDPVVLGDLCVAVRAAETGSVRPARSIDLCVPPQDALRAADALTRLGWVPGRPDPLTEARLEQHTFQRFRMDSHPVLVLHWRPLPQGCSRLVVRTPEDAPGRIDLHETVARTPSPTDQLLRLWARTGDPDPGHQVRTVCATADLVGWYPIDWPRLWSDCERLELTGYGETYLRALPAGVGPSALRQERT